MGHSTDAQNTEIEANRPQGEKSLRAIWHLTQSPVVLAVVGLALLSLVFSLVSPYFLTADNVLNVLRQVSTTGIVAIGATYVIIAGGFDLSVGGVLALSSLIAAVAIRQGVNMFLAICAALAVGAAFGLFNGYLVTGRFRVPPFIATLATMSIARGLTMVISRSRPVQLPPDFALFGRGYVAGIPFPVILMLLTLLVGHLGLSRTKMGLRFYAVGGNPEAARLSGISVRRTSIAAYLISGVGAALGGIVLASRLSSVEPLAGTGYELDAVASAVIGGASLSGGQGTLIGTAIGALITGVLRNGLNLLNVSTYWQQVAIGIAIAATVAIGTLRRR